MYQESFVEISILDVGDALSSLAVNVSLFILIHHPKLIQQITKSIEHLSVNIKARQRQRSKQSANFKEKS